MPPWPGRGTPTARHVVDYLAAYEERYELPVRRPVRAVEVREADDGSGHLDVLTDGDGWRARLVVNATGTSRRPFRPLIPGCDDFNRAACDTASALVERLAAQPSRRG